MEKSGGSGAQASAGCSENSQGRTCARGSHQQHPSRRPCPQVQKPLWAPQKLNQLNNLSLDLVNAGNVSKCDGSILASHHFQARTTKQPAGSRFLDEVVCTRKVVTRANTQYIKGISATLGCRHSMHPEYNNRCCVGKIFRKETVGKSCSCQNILALMLCLYSVIEPAGFMFLCVCDSMIPP